MTHLRLVHSRSFDPRPFPAQIDAINRVMDGPRPIVRERGSKPSRSVDWYKLSVWLSLIAASWLIVFMAGVIAGMLP